jgi:hypothetical protein
MSATPRTIFSMCRNFEDYGGDTPSGTVNIIDFLSGVMDTFPALSLYNKQKAEFDKLVRETAEISSLHPKWVFKGLDKTEAAAATAAVLEDVKATIDAEQQKLDCLFVACMKRSVRLGCDQLTKELLDKDAREKLPLYIGVSIKMYGTTTLQTMKAFSDANGMDALKVCMPKSTCLQAVSHMPSMYWIYINTHAHTDLWQGKCMEINAFALQAVYVKEAMLGLLEMKDEQSRGGTAYFTNNDLAKIDQLKEDAAPLIEYMDTVFQHFGVNARV